MLVAFTVRVSPAAFAPAQADGRWPARDEALVWIIARVEAFNVTITKPAERRRGPARPGSAKIIAQDAATAFGRREQQS